MYRIEVAPGEETVFRTIEELAVGIRNGVITPRSRIYHNASQKWLPIGLHPHYKKAMELPAASAAHPATPTPVPAVPRIKSLSESGEHRPVPKQSAPKVPAPVTSPIVAMQQEVLRDLPLVEIPEPLPWTAPVPAPAPPKPVHSPASAPAAIARIAQAVQAEPAAVAVHPAAVQSQPTATVTYAPLVFADTADEPAHAVHPHAETEEPTHPRPTARRSIRAGGRPLAMVGVAAALVVAGHFALTAMRSNPADATESAPTNVAAEPEAAEPAGVGEEAPAPSASGSAPTGSAERVSTSSARVPMTPGPAFAGSAPADPSDSAAATRAAAPAPTPPAPTPGAPAGPALAPAPVELELAIPDIASDSLVPTARSGDTMAIKKILRALNGAKPAESPSAP